ncbi:MAG TPA: flagellar basal body L-ring protein FlgH [Longimicrobiales bacterium]|nr:flagellar basal body L-ring protein FlgH [Longimicrobiales bacterium]
MIGSSRRIRAWACAAALGALAAAGDATAQATAAQAGPPVRTSWTSDRAPLRVGDVVTILIDEFTQVSAGRDEVASRDRDRELGVTASAEGKGASASARTNNDVAQRNRGESSRRQRFTAEMGVRVIEVGPGGMLKIEGTRTVRVDKHLQEVVVRGWIRPNDVAVDNTVQSWRVAEAEILYTSNGSLVSAGGMWTRLLELIVP